ncbi:MAG: bifunctional phosphoribosylaminoimidazolecarboxamide formyltransferase/IMP cyclohydrolase, partial [Bacteroidetes bacterium]|nr:bifunctional phosphoribosylaminoimidazolecarboxamide formyltransferase/IMP cyclohydrolase [Bacteroidota bacterium]
MLVDEYKIKTALISVSDKTGIVEFAQKLSERGIIIYSTGGTEKLLKENNVPAKSVTELTNFPEILNGRVKTLHPAVHAGLLADLGVEEHRNQIEKLNINSIDLLVVNLYPFEKTLKKEGVTHEELIENIDIGGPTMIRSAAKNYKWTAVVVNPSHYQTIIDYIDKNGAIPEEFRVKLAGEVFNHTAAYDALIAKY